MLQTVCDFKDTASMQVSKIEKATFINFAFTCWTPPPTFPQNQVKLRLRALVREKMG